MGLPLARQEKDWFRLGLVLPRNDMANWVIRCSEEWLTPVYDRIHEKLMECQVLHMDETRIQCNKEEGKKAIASGGIPPDPRCLLVVGGRNICPSYHK